MQKVISGRMTDKVRAGVQGLDGMRVGVQMAHGATHCGFTQHSMQLNVAPEPSISSSSGPVLTVHVPPVRSDIQHA
jgi:hypothetical protein